MEKIISKVLEGFKSIFDKFRDENDNLNKLGKFIKYANTILLVALFILKVVFKVNISWLIVSLPILIPLSIALIVLMIGIIYIHLI